LSSELTQVNTIPASNTAEPTSKKQPNDIVKRRRVRRRKESSTDTKETKDIGISSTKNNLINETRPKPEAKTKNKPTEPKTENTYDTNLTVVGETEEKKPNNGRGGWWNKITGG
jgi:hypothetical protein